MSRIKYLNKELKGRIHHAIANLGNCSTRDVNRINPSHDGFYLRKPAVSIFYLVIYQFFC